MFFYLSIPLGFVCLLGGKLFYVNDYRNSPLVAIYAALSRKFFGLLASTLIIGSCIDKTSKIWIFHFFAVLKCLFLQIFTQEFLETKC